MHNLDKLVYMDLHKTGSSFVSKFLNDTCNQKTIENSKHKPITNEYNQDNFYFITIRNPIKQYESLFCYGLNGNGAFFNELKKSGHDSLYVPTDEGYNKWLEFVLDEKNAEYLGEGYNKNISSVMGFMTYRFMNLSLANPKDKINKIKNKKDLFDVFDSERIIDVIIKNENLTSSLIKLAKEMKPSLFDQDKVDSFVEFNGERKVNASKKPKDNLIVNDDNKRIIMSKESLIFSYYDIDSDIISLG